VELPCFVIFSVQNCRQGKVELSPALSAHPGVDFSCFILFAYLVAGFFIFTYLNPQVFFPLDKMLFC
jgi:hypothetical protein